MKYIIPFYLLLLSVAIGAISNIKVNSKVNNTTLLSPYIFNDSLCDNLLPQQANLVLGGRTVLVIRGVDPATHTWDDTDAELVTLNTELDAYVRSTSFNKAWIETFDITPVYDFTVDPNNNGYYAMSQTLRDIAISNGYNVDDYNVVAYIHQSTTDFGGAGALGSGNGLNGSLWANNNLTWYYQGNIHEIYHAFGVGHAETIEGGDQVYPGQTTGGHDPYHFMGSEGDAGLDSDIPNYMKYYFGWIDPSEVTCVPEAPTACETHRIYKASIVSSYNANHKYALQLGDNLWVSYEPDNANSRILKKGLLLHYVPGPGSAITRLLDTRPQSITDLPSDLGSNWEPVIDFWDAAMEMGDTFNWEGIDIEIVNEGGTGEEKWVDIQLCNCIALSGDSDGDGVCDTNDACDGFDDTADQDYDLIPDGCDSCPNDPNNDSNNDNICDDLQCLNAVSESFDYPTNTAINTADGGTGLSGAWTQTAGLSNSNITIESASLSTPINDEAGNKLSIVITDEVETAAISRALDGGFTTGQNMWLSVVIKANQLADGGLWIRPNNQQASAIGKRWGTQFGIDNNGTNGYNMTSGQEYWLVALYDLQPTQTIVHLWVNPSDSDLQDVTTAHATKTVGSMGDITTLAISLERWGLGAYEIDELKLTCQAPLLTASNKSVQVKAFLQGALINSPDNMMRDDLRNQSMLPMTEPYSSMTNFSHYGNGGGETMSNTMLVDNGNTSIVDWALLELRDPNDPSTIVETQSVLLQKDGQVVNINGDSQIEFNISGSSYYIALRHRNHLGVMTANPITLDGTTLVDFTNSNTLTYGTNAQVEVNGVNALWAGNTTADNTLIYSGNNNDVNTTFFDVLLATANPTQLPNFIESGYRLGDMDLNGQCVFQGNNNDPNTLFFNILTHPTTSGVNYIIEEQLP